jgi:hypothetical protein
MWTPEFIAPSAERIQTETFVIPGRAALYREGKGIHFVEIACFLHQMDALPARFALAGHNNIDPCNRASPLTLPDL